MSFIDNIYEFFKTFLVNKKNNSDHHIYIEKLDSKLIDETFKTPHYPHIHYDTSKHFTFIDVC